MNKAVLSMSFFSLFICVACGSEAPFRRGENSATPFSIVVPQNTANPETPPPGENAPQDQPPQTVTELDKNYFEQAVLPMLEKKCSTCHDNPAATFDEAKKLVVFKDPNNSELHKYATGAGGLHRKILKDGTAELTVLTSWIDGGVLHQ